MLLEYAKELNNLYKFQLAALGNNKIYSINKQKEIVKKLLKEDSLEKNTINAYLEKTTLLEKNKEFNISEEEFINLEKTRDLVTGFYNLFAKEFNELTENLTLLQACLNEILDNKTPSYNQAQLIEKILLLSEKVDSQEEKVQEYLTILKDLKYNKKTLKSGQIVARVIRNVALGVLENKLATKNKVKFLIKINGIENIPKKGPCIIAPHHHHAAFDPLLLKSIVKRPLFFLGATENFVIPIFNKLVNSMATVPYTRDDGDRERITGDTLKQKVEDYDNNNFASMKKLINHMRVGHLVVIFPEEDAFIFGNTYNRLVGQEFIEPKTGFVALSVFAKRIYDIDAPIIPTGIKYSGRTVKITFSEPVFQPQNVKTMEKNVRDKHIEAETKRLFEIIKKLSS